MFLDPSASHLIITTTLGENYYLHTQSRQPKALTRLKGVRVETIAWNPSLPTASTREILIGASDGNVYEVYIELSNEFFRREEKYVKAVYRVPDGPVTGLWVDLLPDRPDRRRVVIATETRLFHFTGRIGGLAQQGSASIFTKLFETETPTVHEVARDSRPVPSTFVVSPDPPGGFSADGDESERSYAWLSAQGVLHGKLRTSATSSNQGSNIFNNVVMLPRNKIPPSENASGRRKPTVDPLAGLLLTQWHILCFVDGRIVAIQRLDEKIVYDQFVLGPCDTMLCMLSDQKKNTFWLLTTQEIFEIVVNDEDRLARADALLSRSILDKLATLRRPAPHPEPVELSTREQEILDLICDDLDDRAIADRLAISRNTGRDNDARLYSKLGVNRRCGAVVWCRERGMGSRRD